MKQKIEAQIENINNSLEWIKNNKPQDYDQKFIQLIELRRSLRKVLSASNNNPGIAAFGKSQVGKSYLISCLLQDNGKPFMVKAGSELHNFVYKINPPSDNGGGKESTGVITRFSSFNRDDKRESKLYSEDYPVLVKAFSVVDLLLVLADSYFNDFGDYVVIDEDYIDSICTEWKNKYSNAPIIDNSPIKSDDMLFMKYYFNKYIHHAHTLNKTSLFDHLTMIVERIPATDYPSIFACLWNNEKEFNNVFTRLLSTLSSFNYAEYIYLPIESVLHKDVKENTIMSVQCLKQLFEAPDAYTSDVYVKKGKEFVKCASKMPKSEICAICSEVVFKIEEGFLSSTQSYAWQNMDESVQNRVNHNPVELKMLRTNDLLDFPGARSREAERLSKLGSSTIMDFFLRGKVAYLFNKYNEEMFINILLYCHHNKDNDVTYLYSLLESWVHNYVGNTPYERKRKIEISHKSPLFYIGTMFNLDMELQPGKVESEQTEETIDQTWIGRFETILNRQCFHRETTDWVKNWTAEGDDFKNSYVLRDFKFSEKLYKGFTDEGKESSMRMSDSFYKKMRSSFIHDKYVQNLFQEPEIAWDTAASMNNDGALYILENLADVALQMDNTREKDFNDVLNMVCNKLTSIMSDYHVSTNVDEILEGNIRKAKAIFREMDFTCNNDNYYFGHLIQALQITESDSYRAIHKIIQSPEINGMVNDFKNYEIIRNSCEKAGHPIENCNTESEKMNCVIETYGFLSAEEAEDYFRKKGIDKQKLFGGLYRRKLNSCIIADSVYTKWCTAIKSVEFFNEFSQEDGFDVTIMNNLVDELILTAEALGVRDIMATSIAEYVDIIDVRAANESLIADMLADTINDFVNDFGFSLLSEEDKLKAKGLCEKRNLPAFKYIEKELPAEMDEVALTNLFNEMSANPKALLPSFEDNYNKWLEYMFISFVAHLDIPDFDHEANVALESLLEKIKVA